MSGCVEDVWYTLGTLTTSATVNMCVYRPVLFSRIKPLELQQYA